MIATLTLPSHLTVHEQEPLARHSTFGVGGPADAWVKVNAVDDLTATLDAAEAAGVPRTVLGHGTNLLVADGGIEGLVISNGCTGLQFDRDTGMARVESGHTMAHLARRSADHGYAGLGFAIGVPGTVGGAIFGNAGAWGSDIATVLANADVWYPSKIRRMTAKAFSFGYRQSALQKDPLYPVVLSGELRVQRDDPAKLLSELEDLAHRRTETQPRGQTAGSFFKNPNGDFAGRLIETSGLKGCTQGGAFVSPMHANFISNDGTATAADILSLALHVQNTVFRQHGVRLEPEVSLLGRWDSTAAELTA
jgi:UDP-N-acetylmuramate dehydrogenase